MISDGFPVDSDPIDAGNFFNRQSTAAKSGSYVNFFNCIGGRVALMTWRTQKAFVYSKKSRQLLPINFLELVRNPTLKKLLHVGVVTTNRLRNLF